MLENAITHAVQKAGRHRSLFCHLVQYFQKAAAKDESKARKGHQKFICAMQ